MDFEGRSLSLHFFGGGERNLVVDAQRSASLQTEAIGFMTWFAAYL